MTRKLILTVILSLFMGATAALAAYVDNGDGTVTDTETGLMWQQETPADTYTWQEALDYCDVLALAGYSDWRLPTRNELQSLVDYSGYGPAIDDAYFPGTASSHYWSSSSVASGAGLAWGVRFSDGDVDVYDKSGNHHARAVRAGQARSFGHLVISEPEQGGLYHANDSLTITWDDQSLGGFVDIYLSKAGGKPGTFSSIANTDNDATYTWTVSGPSSVNCVLRITPQNDPGKLTDQGLFSIDAIPAGEPASSASGLTLSEPTTGSLLLSWTNGDGDGRIVVMKAGSAVDVDPVDLDIYYADAVFTGGSDLGGGNYVVYDDTGSEVTVTGLSPATQYSVAVFEYNGVNGTQNYRVTNPATASGFALAPEPTTQASSVQLTQTDATSLNLSYDPGAGSEHIVLMQSGTSMDGAPVDGDGYTSNLAFGSGDEVDLGCYVVYSGTETSHTVTGLDPGTTYSAAVFSFNGENGMENYLTPGALATQSTLNEEPLETATGVIFSSVGEDSLEINWSNGSGTRRLVLLREGYAVNMVPVDGTSYQDSPLFGEGDTTGDGNYVIYNDTGNMATVTFLSPGTEYFAAVYEYSGEGGVENYLTTDPGTYNGYTLSTEPTTQASSVQLTQAGTRTMALSWTAGDGDGYIVLMSADGPVDHFPQDSLVYPADSAYGEGVEIVTGTFVVYSDVGTSVTVTGLSPETTYHVAVYTYNGSGTTTNYLQAVPAIANKTMPALEPTVSASNLEITPTINSLEISWTPGDGANRLVLMKEDSQVTESPVDGESYSANAYFGLGSVFGDGSHAVYNGLGSSVTVSGLTPATAYYLSVIEYNGSGVTTNYRTPGTAGSGATQGIINLPTSMLSLAEPDGVGEFTIELASTPLHDVTVGLSSDCPDDLTLSADQVVLGSGKLSATVEVAIIDDDLDRNEGPCVITTAPAVSSDPSFADLDPADVSVTLSDDDTAGIIVSPNSISISEMNGSAPVTISLESQPEADVTIALSATTTDVTLSADSVTLSDSNWSDGVEVIVSAVDDKVADGDTNLTLQTAQATGDDPVYGGMNPADVTVTVTDNDVAGVVVSPTELRLSEPDTQGVVTFRLQSEPATPVNIPLSIENDEATVYPEEVTLDGDNWDKGVDAIVTAADDSDVDGEQPSRLLTGSILSGDAPYAGMDPADVFIRVKDDDAAGVWLSHGALNVSEPEGTAAFFVRLTARPSADVTVELRRSNLECTIYPATLTFTPDNYDIDQTVGITAVDDGEVDGTQTCMVHARANSDDFLYLIPDAGSVEVAVADNASGMLLERVYPTLGRTGAEHVLTAALRGAGFMTAGDVKVTGIGLLPEDANGEVAGAEIPLNEGAWEVLDFGEIHLAIPGPDNEGDYRIRVHAGTYYEDLPSALTFAETLPVYKAVIVVGRDEPQSPLWEPSRDAAHYTYQTLLDRRFLKENVYYLSPEGNADIDGDGVADDWDGEATLANVKESIAACAYGEPAEQFVLYMIGHGGLGQFRINETERLKAKSADPGNSLYAWLDGLAPNVTGETVIVYDACNSGTFLPLLADGTLSRTIVASAGPEEWSYYLDDVEVSFSRFFWSHIRGRYGVGAAFDFARDMMSPYQWGILDSDGDGMGTDDDVFHVHDLIIGLGGIAMSDVPTIAAAYLADDPAGNTLPAGARSAELVVDSVDDTQGISRVWAEITSPCFGITDSSITEVDLAPADADGTAYNGLLDGFTYAGEYEITIRAKDKTGNYNSVLSEMRVYKEDGLSCTAPDLNDDGTVNLADAILALRVLTGLATLDELPDDYVDRGLDVNGDARLGLPEAVEVLRYLAGE